METDFVSGLRWLQSFQVIKFSGYQVFKLKRYMITLFRRSRHPRLDVERLGFRMRYSW